jgi:hypothetical protein
MSKRELGAISNGAAVDVDAPRAKRHRTGTASSPLVDEAGRELIDVVKTEDDGEQLREAAEMSVVEVKEQGLKLWQTVKDAVNKECARSALYLSSSSDHASDLLSTFHGSRRGRILSISFMQQPSKRQYPDYYELIKKPIALKDIKSQLDGELYHSLEEVKHDLEQCFINAKKYNIRESQIWKDAKHLHVRSSKSILAQ